MRPAGPSTPDTVTSTLPNGASFPPPRADGRYDNEGAVGAGLADFLKASGTPRSDVFITSKLMRNRGYKETLRDLRASVKRAGLEYFDLYLLHSPIGGAAVRKECWRALIDGKKEGLVKSIGVSNFAPKHIEEIVARGDELPVVNQIDLHPFMRHPEYVDSCRKHGILLEVSPSPRDEGRKD